MTITRTTNKNNTVDVTSGGMDINKQDRGDWLQNLYIQDGSIIVREGFGQVTRISTELLASKNVPNEEIVNRGFQKVLGSYYINTDFGHEQLLTIVATYGWSADITNTSLASTKNVYSVIIYDITTDIKKEIVLYEHTSFTQTTQVPLFLQYGHYETTKEVDHQEWREGDEDIPFFTEYSDRVFFGSNKMGLWYYTPCIFTADEKNVLAPVTRTFTEGQHESTFRSEDAIITQVGFNENKVFTGESVNLDGSISQLETYATNSQIYPIKDATTFYGRLVYASGRTVWFSDQFKPNSVSARNFITLDSEEEITSIQALRDSIIIWTPNETYLYLPNNDPYTVSAGRLYQLSKNVGCISSQAKVRVGDGVMWVDRNGFWSNNGDIKVTKLSEPIDPFFNTYVSRPLTNFFKYEGGKVGQNGQKINIDVTGSGIHVVYEPEQQRTFFVFPNENFAWVLDTGGWKLWTWKTIANNEDEETIDETENILSPRVVVDGKGGIYIVGGMDIDTTYYADDRTFYAINNRSFYILKWKRGGGVDRSNVLQEDKVNFTGEYYASRTVAETDKAKVIIDKPIAVPVGTPIYSFKNPDAAPYVAQEKVYLVPIRWLSSDIEGRQEISTIDFEFTYNNTNFQFISDPTAGNAAELLAVVPTERIGSAPGWSLGSSNFAVPFSFVITAAAGAPAVGGPQLWCRFSGQAGWATGNTWSYNNGAVGLMNTAANSCQTLFYLVMRKVGTAEDAEFVASNVASFWNWSDATFATYTSSAIIWRGTPYADQQMTEDEKVQPVEWVYKTKQVGDGDVNIKSRGITNIMLSTGRAITSIFPNWVYGLYNSILGSDQKEWATQVVDYVDPNGNQDKNIQNIKRIVNKDTTIPRLREAPTFATVKNSYGNAQAKWASLPDGTDGTVLSSNNAVNNITQSDSVRGGRLSYTLFGFVLNKAEKIRFNTLRVAMRVVGALRRR